MPACRSVGSGPPRPAPKSLSLAHVDLTESQKDAVGERGGRPVAVGGWREIDQQSV